VSSDYVPRQLRERIREQARNRCGYCLAPQELLYGPLEIEHLLPRSLGGTTNEENLWMACRVCNGYKGDQVSSADPETGLIVALFNPRRQLWTNHFEWSSDGALVIGLTSSGRATVVALQLNNLDAVRTRRLWVSVGWHPPLG